MESEKERQSDRLANGNGSKHTVQMSVFCFLDCLREYTIKDMSKFIKYMVYGFKENIQVSLKQPRL